MQDNHQWDTQSQLLPFSLSSVLHGAIRIVGVIVLIIGLWIGFSVLNAAWKLYSEPDQLKKYAQKIEQGSNINKAFNSFIKELFLESQRLRNIHNPNPVEVKPDLQPWNLAYFIAMFLKIVLLFIIGKIAFYAMGEGGKLAFSLTTANEQFARTLAREMAAESAQLYANDEAMRNLSEQLLQRLQRSQ